MARSKKKVVVGIMHFIQNPAGAAQGSGELIQMIKISNSKDFYAGLIFLFFGLLTLAINRSYPMGTAARMGPGFSLSFWG
jgi:hypothetical protein